MRPLSLALLAAAVFALAAPPALTGRQKDRAPPAPSLTVTGLVQYKAVVNNQDVYKLEVKTSWAGHKVGDILYVTVYYSDSFHVWGVPYYGTSHTLTAADVPDGSVTFGPIVMDNPIGGVGFSYWVEVTSSSQCIPHEEWVYITP